ncbi:MAG: pro-sigmaK processing inhibitor BofA family protein [Bacilli bacterium]|jgi:hypothetical protein|nr:pro-sigmaK processing inhibitor BofA family protein [Bacilli bacterium]
MKIIINTFNKIIIGFLMIYGYNLLMYPLNLFIPINMINLSITSLFGIKGLLYLCSVLILIF